MLTNIDTYFGGLCYITVFDFVSIDSNNDVLPPPLQVIVGSFIADGRKESRPINQAESLSAQPKLAPGFGTTGASSPPSHGTLSESSGGAGSPLNHSTGNNTNPQGMSSMPWR